MSLIAGCNGSCNGLVSSSLRSAHGGHSAARQESHQENGLDADGVDCCFLWLAAVVSIYREKVHERSFLISAFASVTLTARAVTVMVTVYCIDRVYMEL